MDIKKFQLICKFTSVILKIVTAVLLFTIIIGAYLLFFTDVNLSFNVSSPGFPILNSSAGSIDIADAQLAVLIITPPMTIIISYIMLKGSQIFNRLANGETPFSSYFSKSLKNISLILIILDIFGPLLHSLVLTTIMESGHYIIVGVGTSLLIGLILLAVSEILKYGAELQKLSDNTV